MTIKCKRFSQRGNFFNLYENKKIALGYTENKFKLGDLGTYFHNFQIVELKQIHSNNIWFSDKIKRGSRGDGIILNEKQKIAVIRTADCVPLFFWDKDYSIGGILHIGWRGLHKQIEKKLLEELKRMNMNLRNICFYFGPCIEKKCYKVDLKLYDKFQENPHRDSFFSKEKDKLLMDLKRGISISLIKTGVLKTNIFNSELCNFCNKERFPSYRRDGKSENRILNFLFFK